MSRLYQTGAAGAQTAAHYFGIQAVNSGTGRGVPLVEFETVNNIVYVTDSNGWVAIHEPGLMGGETFFHVRSHGYSVPKDGFGYAGVRLTPTPGGRAQVKLTRVNIAERVCRLTGEGIYDASVLLGVPTPLKNPVLSGKIFGQDSALAVLYKGKKLWFWGDTNRPDYPLGNFHTTGAVASFPRGHRTAEAGLDFEYFTGNDGFARAMVPSNKPGPIWVFGVTTLGEPGREELLAHYTRVKNLGERYEHGWVQWDDRKNEFAYINELPLMEKWRFLEGHPLKFIENGTEYRMSGASVPHVRVPATRAALINPNAYEAYTCLDNRGNVLRDAKGAPAYRWQKELPPISSEQEAKLVEQKQLRLEETHYLPRDASGKPVVLHGGSVTWNPLRKKYLCIATQKFGKESSLGEIWYAEADQPTGPFSRAVKIITHNKYTFYNPVHHPFLDEAGGRIIYLEGTYTRTFSDAPVDTPRYEYNQMLYKLDLTDSRLRFAQG